MGEQPAGGQPPGGDASAGDEAARESAATWQSPSGSPGGAGSEPPQYGPPQYGQPQYGQPQHGQPEGGQQQPQYGPPPGYAPPQYGPAQYGPPQYGQPQYGQPQYGQPQYAPPQYAPPPHAGQQWGQWAAPPADKPGVIPLRPLAVGEILDGVFTTIRQNPKAVLGLSFVIVLVGQLATLGLQLAGRGADTGVLFGVAVGSLLISQLVATIATGAVIVVVGEAVLGSRISAADALGRLSGRIWRLIGVSLLVFLITVLGLLLILPGIYWMVLFSFATPVFVLERTRIRQALSRSAELVRGSWWRTLGIGLLGYLVGSVLSGIVTIPFALIAQGSTSFLSNSDTDISVGNELILALGRLIGGTLSTPIIAGTFALMYVDRRMRREGLDLVLAQTARERRGQS